MVKESTPALSIGAATIAGIALWFNRASFDVAGTTAAPVRVAMLPSLAELTGLIVMMLLIAAGMAALLRSQGGRSRLTPSSFWEPATDALLPLFSLSLLVIPYLPWLADWMPSLRLLAGPGRVLIWMVVIGQVLWVFLPRLSERLGLTSPVINPSKAAAIFGISSVALSAPFALNVGNIPTAFVDLFQTLRHLPSASWSLVPTGSLGVLFDQEYGIVPFAPVLLLACIGLAGMLRDPSHRRLAMVLGLMSVFLILLPGTLDPWWSRSAMPGEQVMLLLPLLVAPIAWLYARLPHGSPARAGAQALMLFSSSVTLAMLFGLVPVRQEADGSSALLQWAAPTWRLSSEAPTFVVGSSGAATARVLVWLAVSGIVAWIFSRARTSSAGRAALAATTGMTLVFAALVFATSLTMSDSAKRFNVEGRVLFPLLETFDPVARPIGLRYDPWSRVGPGDLPPLFALSAVAGQRTDRQPVRVVLNARFRLPAGRYVLDLTGSDIAGSVPNASLALQLGREGRPIETWPLSLVPGGSARHEFEVPLDAEFVGFRAARRVEATIAGLRVSPLSVVEARKRFPAATVLSAAAYAPARVFFHDSFSYSEAEGFWVRGRSEARMTLLKTREADAGIQLAVHSGARPNVVTIATAGWSQKLELVPGVTQRLIVPSNEGERFVPLTIASANGFVPAEIAPSRDRRVLGAWVGFIPGDIARTSSAP